MSFPVRIVIAVMLGAMLNACSHGETKGSPPRAAGETAATSGAAQAVPAATTGTSGTAAPAVIDQAAIKALDNMGAYLRTLTAFQVLSETTRDEALDDGQGIQYGGRVDLLVQRPDRLRAEVTSDRQQRFYFYDGKSFTLWANRVNYYATVPAPPTLAALGERLQTKYGIEMPLADLFTWGTTGNTAAAIKAAADIGPSQIEGVSCEHYAFRQDDVDWQVWIQLGNFPLPRKLVITTTTDPARPQYTSVLNWNLAPSYNDAAFRFDPPRDAHKITFNELPGSGSDR
jgi:hypothetical protein